MEWLGGRPGGKPTGRAARFGAGRTGYGGNDVVESSSFGDRAFRQAGSQDAIQARQQFGALDAFQAEVLVQAGRAAMRMAGVGPADVTMCQIYDCYTFTVLLTLEDYGFCPKGEGGPFVASGVLGPGGKLPLNTGGGQLSGYYMWGMTPLSEAVIQARGQGGARQSPAHDIVLVSGNGGVLDHHSTLVLASEAGAQ